MGRLAGFRVFVAVLAMETSIETTQAQKLMEKLDRGVVAIHEGKGRVFVGWRLLGTEQPDLGFNVYRTIGDAPSVKINSDPLTGPTHFQDFNVKLDAATRYSVRSIVDGVEQMDGHEFTLTANAPVQSYIEIPLQLPTDTSPGDASAADLDGDGDYEIILKGIQRSRDTASPGVTGNTVLQAYQTDGRLMWTIQMGINIREGEHDTQFMVYDLDGDGKAELACRTSDGSVDGAGKVIGQAGKDWRDMQPGSRSLGKNMTGPEYLTIFDGATSKELISIPYVPNQLPQDGWGGIGGNSNNDSTGNRNMRFLAAIAYLDGVRPSLIMCRGVYGRTVLVAWDYRGGKLTQRWIFDSGLHDRSGAPYVTQSATVDPKLGLTKITDNIGSWDGIFANVGMVWDRNGAKEYCRVIAIDGKTITVDKELTPGQAKPTHVYGYSGMGGHALSVADVDNDGKDEIIYTTTIPTTRRIYTLMHDPQYRMAIAWQNVSYNQPPHTSFFIGNGMQEPPRPNIALTIPVK